MSRINVTNAQLLEEIRALRNEINGLKETQALLLRHLAPLFPRVGTDPVNTNEAIDTATRDAQASAAATPLNPDFHAIRDIQSYLPEAVALARQANLRTANNTTRLLAFLRHVARMENGEVDEGVISSNYECMKKVAVQVRRELQDAYPKYKECTWKDVDLKDKNVYTLLLEKRIVNKYSLPLDRCVDSWAADRLMFESFRGSGGKSDSNKRRRVEAEAGDESRTTSNHDFIFVAERPSGPQ